MIKFVIVEDNQIHKKRVKNLIMSFMMNNKLEFDIEDFDDYGNDLLLSIKKNDFDTIYILDLELPNGDGIDIARTIRYTYNNWRSPIIICTAHTSLAYEVYKQRLQILDFIGKCFDVEKNINEALEICMKMLNRNHYYRYRYHNIDYCIPLESINYIERDGRRTRFNTNNEKYYQNISINALSKLLPSFFKISSKGIMINMNNIERIDWKDMKIFFKNGDNGFLISKYHKKEIMNYEYN